MTNYAVRVTDVGKRYQIGARVKNYPTLRDSIMAAVRSPRRAWRERNRKTDEFWALKDVTFDVADGNARLRVAYTGILPDLFREGQGVVAEGALDSAGTFKADTVLAKHDETYMPKSVADELKKQGHWKDDYGKQVAQEVGGTTCEARRAAR